MLQRYKYVTKYTNNFIIFAIFLFFSKKSRKFAALNCDKSVKIQQVLSALERFAPLPLQESYDNAGLQIGLTEAEVSGALLCLDVTEKIIDEAVANFDAHQPGQCQGWGEL